MSIYLNFWLFFQISLKVFTFDVRSAILVPLKKAREDQTTIVKEIKEIIIMKKFVCTVCGYVYEGEAAPAECPVCHAPASKFKEQSAERTWAAELVVGVAQGVSEDILEDLRANFAG